ncbi:hypothetical protein ACFL3E_00795 [Patescibacteria group bacterium]
MRPITGTEKQDQIYFRYEIIGIHAGKEGFMTCSIEEDNCRVFIQELKSWKELERGTPEFKRSEKLCAGFWEARNTAIFKEKRLKEPKLDNPFLDI